MEAAIRGSLTLPKTTFPMRASAAVREPALSARLTSELYVRQAARRAGRRTWALHDGPPYANGSLHMGHMLNKVLKDVFNRHRLMRGQRVRYVPGAEIAPAVVRCHAALHRAPCALPQAGTATACPSS